MDEYFIRAKFNEPELPPALTPCPSEQILVTKKHRRKHKGAEYEIREIIKGQKFIINLGRIARNTTSFEMFHGYIVPYVSPFLLNWFLDRIDNYAAEYASILD